MKNSTADHLLDHLAEELKAGQEPNIGYLDKAQITALQRRLARRIRGLHLEHVEDTGPLEGEHFIDFIEEQNILVGLQMRLDPKVLERVGDALEGFFSS